MTSQVHPLHDRLQSQLISRLLGGLTIPLALPDLETRTALLEQWARERDWTANAHDLREFARQRPVTPADLRRYFLETCSTFARGATLSSSLLTGKRGRTATPAPTDPGMQNILCVVARQFSLAPRDLVGSSRRRTVTTARGVAIHLARSTTQASLQEIGRMLGNRDHSTVINSLRRIQKLMLHDSALRDTVEDLEQKLQGKHLLV
jgi:chromosomal replication initiator protein